MGQFHNTAQRESLKTGRWHKKVSSLQGPRLVKRAGIGEIISEVDIEVEKAENNSAEFVALLWRLCFKYDSAKFKKDFSTSGKISKKIKDKYIKYLV